MMTLGASLELVEAGRVHISLPFSPALAQQPGFVHAGVISKYCRQCLRVCGHEPGAGGRRGANRRV